MQLGPSENTAQASRQRDFRASFNRALETLKLPFATASISVAALSGCAPSMMELEDVVRDTQVGFLARPDSDAVSAKEAARVYASKLPEEELSEIDLTEFERIISLLLEPENQRKICRTWETCLGLVQSCDLQRDALLSGRITVVFDSTSEPLLPRVNGERSSVVIGTCSDEHLLTINARELARDGAVLCRQADREGTLEFAQDDELLAALAVISLRTLIHEIEHSNVDVDLESIAGHNISFFTIEEELIVDYQAHLAVSEIVHQLCADSTPLFQGINVFLNTNFFANLLHWEGNAYLENRLLKHYDLPSVFDSADELITEHTPPLLNNSALAQERRLTVDVIKDPEKLEQMREIIGDRLDDLREAWRIQAARNFISIASLNYSDHTLIHADDLEGQRATDALLGLRVIEHNSTDIVAVREIAKAARMMYFRKASSPQDFQRTGGDNPFIDPDFWGVCAGFDPDTRNVFSRLEDTLTKGEGIRDLVYEVLRARDSAQVTQLYSAAARIARKWREVPTDDHDTTRPHFEYLASLIHSQMEIVIELVKDESFYSPEVMEVYSMLANGS